MSTYEKTKYKSVFKTNSGKYVYITRANNKTIKSHPFDKAIDARDELDKLKIEVRNEKTNEFLNLPTFEDLCTEFLTFTKLNKAKGTADKTRKIINNHFYSIIDKTTPINKVFSPDNVLKVISRVNDKEYIEDTKRYIVSLFMRLAERAKLQNLIDEQQLNYVLLNMKGISFKNLSSGREREKYFYTYDEFKKFSSSIDSNFYKVLFDVLFYCGLRIGELLGLRGCSIKDNTLTVDHQLLDDGETLTTQLKTKNSKRCIYISDSLFIELQAYKASNSINDDARLFPISRTTLRRYTNNILEKSGTDFLNIHGFRHSCVALLMKTYIDNKLPINFKQISDYIGDTVQTVLDVYSHIYEEDNTSIINLLPHVLTTYNNMEATTK